MTWTVSTSLQSSILQSLHVTNGKDSNRSIIFFLSWIPFLTNGMFVFILFRVFKRHTLFGGHRCRVCHFQTSNFPTLCASGLFWRSNLFYWRVDKKMYLTYIHCYSSLSWDTSFLSFLFSSKLLIQRFSRDPVQWLKILSDLRLSSLRTIQRLSFYIGLFGFMILTNSEPFFLFFVEDPRAGRYSFFTPLFRRHDRDYHRIKGKGEVNVSFYLFFFESFPSQSLSLSVKLCPRGGSRLRTRLVIYGRWGVSSLEMLQTGLTGTLNERKGSVTRKLSLPPR